MIPHDWSSSGVAAQFIQQQQQHPAQQPPLAPPTHLQSLPQPHQPHHSSQQHHQQQQRSPHFLVSSQPAVQASTDPASSDEALSPLHQEDMEDAMGMKEASKLQQEIVKAWKQKKRPNCEMKTRTQDKYRQVYSSHQRFELEKEYHFQKYISTARKSELSKTLRLSERQIKIWFQNRRAKERRQRKNQQRGGLPKVRSRRPTWSSSCRRAQRRSSSSSWSSRRVASASLQSAVS
ncbi:hypothetical protein BOX15_Mlig012559g1 [Macrostomum lignano]|uniref:Homeobox domain-containing protein n=1 Tax=Macrostomum lignano TaxID=282301 RepID=A0A267F295_9PLAT|nr:hypothetical protein BOX15_Mlig012559g1 [Macrostomum lignano]